MEILRDGFAVIAGHAWREILRRFDAAGGRFDGNAGDGYGRAGPSGIGVERFIADGDALRGVGKQDADFLYVGSHVEGLDLGG